MKAFSVLNLGKALLVGGPNGLAEITFQTLQFLIVFYTFALNFGIHHLSRMAAMVLEVPRCIIRLCIWTMSTFVNGPSGRWVGL